MVVFKLTAPLPGKLIPVLLVLGALALGVGCYAGFAANADRVVVFVLFGISVALFLAALSLPLVWRAHSPASSALKALVLWFRRRSSSGPLLPVCRRAFRRSR